MTVFDKGMTRDGNATAEVNSPPRKEIKLPVRDGDLVHRRKEAAKKLEDGRGRRRERRDDELIFDIDIDPATSNNPTHDYDLAQTPTFSRPRSRQVPPYPPSPSLPPLPTPQSTPTLQHTEKETRPRLSATSDKPRSSILDQPLSGPLPPLEAASSPWSTDDESAWESGSATTSLSLPSSSRLTATPPSLNDNDHSPQPTFLPPFAETDEDDDNVDLNHDWSQEHLPHIPLRPFRNQVGGHSAIYKFTKRAVCKVSIIPPSSSNSLHLCL
jgi:inositol-hexakisphosphate kinase